jgi:hypothetical protein
MKTQKVNPILIPYDFTSISDVAIEHAANMSQLTGHPLILLNIVDESTQKFIKQNNITEESLKTSLEKICKKIEEKFHLHVDYLLRKTDILSICNIAEELKIPFMFIGIDQYHNIASKVLKMIGNSPAPVYIVQGNIEWKNISTIAFPVDSFEETRQKISCTIKVAKHTKATVRLFSIKIKNKERQNIQQMRVKQIEKLLREKGIPFVTDYAKNDEKKFPDELLEYAETNNSDIFVLMKTPRSYFANLFINPIDKKVLFNSKNIPSIYVNPKEMSNNYYIS